LKVLDKRYSIFAGGVEMNSPTHPRTTVRDIARKYGWDEKRVVREMRAIKNILPIECTFEDSADFLVSTTPEPEKRAKH